MGRSGHNPFGLLKPKLGGRPRRVVPHSFPMPALTLCIRHRPLVDWQPCYHTAKWAEGLDLQSRGFPPGGRETRRIERGAAKLVSPSAGDSPKNNQSSCAAGSGLLRASPDVPGRRLGLSLGMPTLDQDGEFSHQPSQSETSRIRFPAPGAWLPSSLL